VTAIFWALVIGQGLLCACLLWSVRRFDRLAGVFGSYAVEDRKVSDLLLRFVSEAEHLRRSQEDLREAVEIALAERANGHKGVA